MDFPKLRLVDAYPVVVEEKKYVCLRDPMNYTEQAVYLPLPAFFLVSLFDGNRSLGDIRTECERQFRLRVTDEEIREIVASLDQNLFLQSPHFEQKKEEMIQAFRDSPVRPAFLAGKSYNPDKKEVLRWMGDVFRQGTEKRPEEEVDGTRPIRGIVVPHYDLRFAGSSYSIAYEHLRDTDAEVFVILGTGHHLSNDFFSCLDKDFETPLGISKTDTEFLGRLESEFGETIYPDILVHKMEHSIEFQVLFLQYLFNGKKDYSIVPILLSFPEFMDEIDHQKFNQRRLDLFFDALAKTIRETGKKVCLIASVDFSHVGERFGDTSAMDGEFLSKIETDDRRLLKHLGKMEIDGFLRSVRETNTQNRVCGYPALHTLMKTFGSTGGTLLEYRQNVEEGNNSMVSFASMLIH